jgi:hypothetical protein
MHDVKGSASVDGGHPGVAASAKRRDSRILQRRNVRRSHMDTADEATRQGVGLLLCAGIKKLIISFDIMGKQVYIKN